jgi:anti-anti-sigma regulatory factor
MQHTVSYSEISEPTSALRLQLVKHQQGVNIMTNTKEYNFTLPATITIDNIESLAKDLLALNIENGATLTLDASHTEIITTPGAQLLIALDKSLTNKCGKLIVYQPKDVLMTVFKSLGLEHYLTKWSA